ncbi:uncharacterized protein BDR25DRAFT_60843 [Lindgomyces ingoldianus]|uniref:Uncharacterized protein n=1 Tax=Lindgomyces ingoldianus TaxID=673940 RepID=A0ACB6QM75_9PLEO|nr:uncharacterized protein BDR25DRAFT_60843 [Lindgomyces ingoldianus]KAF2467972.1 hypothetical protein BDR25DRAFT_60843 [Lindgomyces ingoldianus]
MNNLAFTLKGQGRDEEAIRLLEECVSSRTCVLGHFHHLTANSTEALAGWRAEQSGIDRGIS